MPDRTVPAGAAGIADLRAGPQDFTSQSWVGYTRVMASVEPIRRPARDPVALHSRAMDNLRYIRETMERAGSFTAVPGWGGCVMGLTALVAALVAARQPGPDRWLITWLMEGMLAIGIGAIAMKIKSEAAGEPLFSTPARRFVLSFAPPLFAGALLGD